MAQKRGPKGNSKLRYERITSYLEAAGAYRVPKTVKEELAKTLGVTVRQIELDINRLLERVIRPKLKRISGQFTLTLNSNLNDAHELKRSTDPDIKARGITAANSTISTYTDFLEKFGFKEKIADRHEFEGLAGNFTLVTRTPEQIKNGKKNKDTRNRAGNQQEADRNLGSS